MKKMSNEFESLIANRILDFFICVVGLSTVFVCVCVGVKICAIGIYVLCGALCPFFGGF